ncbi:MAG: hypothetical protein KDA80_21640 [Planctomycetaceae bacterium]|nr:hypothetical protein [Planctomycetaceae bacterium]
MYAARLPESLPDETSGSPWPVTSQVELTTAQLDSFSSIFQPGCCRPVTTLEMAD